jgi:peroxiredoxin Q/BCP
MKWMIGLGAVAMLAAATAVFAEEAGTPVKPAELKVGDKAPDFKLVGTDGKTYTLKQFHKKSAVVIAWYPKALTGG